MTSQGGKSQKTRAQATNPKSPMESQGAGSQNQMSSAELIEAVARFAVGFAQVAETIGYPPRKAQARCRAAIGRLFGSGLLDHVGLGIQACSRSELSAEGRRTIDGFSAALLQGEIIGSSQALLSTDAQRAFARWCARNSVAPTPYRYVPTRLTQAHGFGRLRIRYEVDGKMCGPHTVLLLPSLAFERERARIERDLVQAHAAVERFVTAPTGRPAIPRTRAPNGQGGPIGKRRAPHKRGEGRPHDGAGAT